MKGFKKYGIVFLLTAGIFACAWFVSAYFNGRKLEQLQKDQDTISVKLLSSENQFSLNQELSCDAIDTATISNQIATLADKINYTEQSIGDEAELANLKKQYAILEVKDFLLNKRINERCKTNVSTILYFYGTKASCSDCVKQSYVLDAIRQEYPNVRIYAFDYNLDLSTITTLKSIYKVDNVPSLVVDTTTLSGFQSLAQLEALLSNEVPATDAALMNTLKQK